MLNYVKNILTHITHTTHANIWPTQPTLPRNPLDLADSLQVRNYLSEIKLPDPRFGKF